MADMMTFPDTWEEFEELYHITDTEQIYTNGARLIPSFRVEQWLEHIAEQTEPNCSEKPTSSEKPNNCETCKHDLWHTPRMCGKCVRQEDGKPSMYEPKTEPQIIACPIQEEDAEYARWLYEPQTDIEIARAIVHKAIDDAVIAEDAYPDLRQKMHDAVDNYEPQTDCAWGKGESDVLV